MYRMKRVLGATAALLLPLGLVTAIGSGPAMAAAAPSPGTVNCTTITGSFKFSPPLTLAGTGGSEVVTAKTTLTNCTATGGKTPKKGTTISTSTDATNGCVAVLQGAAKSVTLTTKWSPGSIAPSVGTFPPATTSGDPATIKFGGPGTTGTGSYPGSDSGKSSTAQITLGQTTAQITTLCQSAKGLKGLTVVSGSAHVG